jgi:hypothetical protein
MSQANVITSHNYVIIISEDNDTKSEIQYLKTTNVTQKPVDFSFPVLVIYTSEAFCHRCCIKLLSILYSKYWRMNTWAYVLDPSILAHQLAPMTFY